MARPGIPRKRLGCVRMAANSVVVLLALLIPFVYWNFVRTPPLKISKETTYITGPLTSDSKRVDYFAALEQEFYPPGMKTDDNGYRSIVRALGVARAAGVEKLLPDQIYEKLGLDPAIKPTLTCIESIEFLQTHCRTKGIPEEQAQELEDKLYRPWTLDEFPMMQPWLRQNGPVLDLLANSVRKPTYCIPLVRFSEDAMPIEVLAVGEMQRARAFARMAAQRANYRIGTGDVSGAIDDVITCERLGRQMESQATIVSRLVGMAIEVTGAYVGVASGKSQPSIDQLRRFRDELGQLPPRPSMERCAMTERYCNLDLMQSMASRRISPDVVLLAWDHREKYGTAIAEYFSVDWNIVMKHFNARWDDWEHGPALEAPVLYSPSSILIGSRSRTVADLATASGLPSLQATCEAIHRSDCIDNLRQIALAMRLYEGEHGTLPPAYTVDANNRPLHSWRVLLLPYLGQQSLFGKLRLDEPWDSKHNRQFHDAAVPIYQCRSAALKPGQTTYSVIVGEKAAFQGRQGKTLADLGAHLILVVEREPMTSAEKSARSVCWMDPMSDLSQSIAVAGINRRNADVSEVGSLHPGGINVSLRDASVRFISETVDLSIFQALIEGTAKESWY